MTTFRPVPVVKWDILLTIAAKSQAHTGQPIAMTTAEVACETGIAQPGGQLATMEAAGLITSTLANGVRNYLLTLAGQEEAARIVNGADLSGSSKVGANVDMDKVREYSGRLGLRDAI